MAADFLPRDVLSPPEAARKRVALVVAAAMGSAALAGVWVRMEDGLLLRLVLAATTAILSWLVIDVALSASDGAAAVGRALGMSIVTGAVNTVLPTIIVTSHDSGPPFVPCLVAGGFCGAFVGLAYGLVMCIVAGVTWRQIALGTHDGVDRAVRRAAIWTIVPLGLSAWVVFGYDRHLELSEWASQRDRAAHAVAFPLGLLALGIAFWVALISFKVAHERLARRRKWLALVTSGFDPRWGVREIGPHDDVGKVPRLRDGFSVLEHKNEHAVYRATATGEAVALI